MHVARRVEVLVRLLRRRVQVHRVLLQPAVVTEQTEPAHPERQREQATGHGGEVDRARGRHGGHVRTRRTNRTTRAVRTPPSRPSWPSTPSRCSPHSPPQCTCALQLPNMTAPPDGTDPEPDFDPYRFGAPEHPVPPEYAPPGYKPPQPAQQPPPQPFVPPPPGQQGGYPPPAYQPGPPPPQQYAPYGVPYYAHPRRGTGKAIASMVLGIGSIVLSILSLFDLLLIIPGVVFGIIALAEANRSPNREGRGMAIAGLVCAGVGAVLAIVLTVWFVGAARHCGQYDSSSSQFQSCFRDHL